MNTVQTLRSQSNHNPAPRGGQHHVGPFGYRSFTDSTPAPAALRGDDQPRRVGGLSYAQRGTILRAKMAVAAVLARKGQVPMPAPVQPTTPTTVQSEASKVAVAFLQACKAKPIAPDFSVEQFQAWCDAHYAEAMAHQDEHEGAGLAAERTPAMERAAAERERQDERDWNDPADLAATPEWHRTLPYGSVETACAQD